MSDDTKIQWHPAFCSAVELTLWDNVDLLDYTREFNLSNKPLQVDLLVINKDDNVQVLDAFGKIFRRHNLLEYKSPGDALNIDTYYKMIGYGCLYKALAGKDVDDIQAGDITLSLVRREKPDGLMEVLRSSGIGISSNYPGIYNLHGNVLFETQIISTEELPPGTHIWLKALTRDIGKEEARQIVKSMTELPAGSKKRQLADSVFQVAMSANYEMFKIMKKEDPIMRDALRELMKPELEEAVDKKAKDVAERMIRDGVLPDEKIAEYTGLTIKQVQKIKSEVLVTA